MPSLVGEDLRGDTDCLLEEMIEDALLNIGPNLEALDSLLEWLNSGAGGDGGGVISGDGGCNLSLLCNCIEKAFFGDDIGDDSVSNVALESDGKPS